MEALIKLFGVLTVIGSMYVSAQSLQTLNSIQVKTVSASVVIASIK